MDNLGNGKISMEFMDERRQTKIEGLVLTRLVLTRLVLTALLLAVGITSLV